MALVGTLTNTALSSVGLLVAIAISCNSLAIRPLVFQPLMQIAQELSGRCEMLSGRSEMLSGSQVLGLFASVI